MPMAAESITMRNKSRLLQEPEVNTDIDLGAGDAPATAWGCDLSYEYVRINGSYRT